MVSNAKAPTMMATDRFIGSRKHDRIAARAGLAAQRMEFSCGPATPVRYTRIVRPASEEPKVLSDYSRDLQNEVDSYKQGQDANGHINSQEELKDGSTEAAASGDALTTRCSMRTWPKRAAIGTIERLVTFRAPVLICLSQIVMTSITEHSCMPPSM